MNDGIPLFGSTLDFSQLEVIKIRAVQASRRGISGAAQQVEGLFLDMMLKSMRAALPQEGLLTSAQTHLYTSLYDQQLAQDLATSGVGLAQGLRRQLGGGDISPLAPAAQWIPAYNNAVDPRQLRLMPEQLIGDGLASPLEAFVDGPWNLNADTGGFITHITASALQVARDSGLPHQLIVAQAALESGWGAREIRTAHGAPSYNLFGIKADAGWRGESTQITTTEYVDGVMQKVKAKFRVYASYGEALRDYTRLLTENPRYRRVMQARTPEQAARSLQSSGYATDPHYADKLITIIAQLKMVGQRAQAAYQHDLATLF
ncbi:hypothetical protein BG74_04370 [Sodalis-like endosymbiont of Proechinophthirus fluctus]|uniref:flagellar assembly peptidoglycan hydrolase FlgJ n=1 Tax=Sodalis-like endosymbiont of Proechinophthirus fluctus TaxID=1462730 RepID=UPI0007A824A3|nr:flagellar assembly peptidoglycan hydrolase FlgJ [Sodalis-like endosymbiont of Proechinophthirus fluctus]KYP97217.1 hypothetical protein BG74_04370 [Sodalis-like endosymbiont of Proechinophthirus fluctus]